MLKDLTNERLIRLNIEASDWEDAIRKSAQPLIDEGKAKLSYVDDMIAHLLVQEGFSTLQEIAYVEKDELLSIEGFDEGIVEELQKRAENY
ncbi:MAG: hypothetical protein EOM11_03135, partial [Erysipelotrichia bacterium]|nr:hypothetical protein [Erysipelotrichia bacterium]